MRFGNPGRDRHSHRSPRALHELEALLQRCDTLQAYCPREPDCTRSRTRRWVAGKAGLKRVLRLLQRAVQGRDQGTDQGTGLGSGVAAGGVCDDLLA